VQVHGDDLVEVVVAHLPQHGVAQDAGVGDEDVEASEVLDRGGDEGIRGLGAADRSDDGDCGPAVGDDRRDRRLSCRGIHVVDDDGRALTGEFARVGESEALPAAGDDGGLACE
jgi:hypothetical protein